MRELLGHDRMNPVLCMIEIAAVLAHILHVYEGVQRPLFGSPGKGPILLRHANAGYVLFDGKRPHHRSG